MTPQSFDSRTLAPAARGVIPRPDPAEPVLLGQVTGGKEGPGLRWRKTRQRRAQILAASRRLLAERGYEGVSVRAIAEACSITPPTVYNIVGGRMQVICDASAEWVRWLVASASTQAPGDDAPPHAIAGDILRILNRFWMSAIDYPEYTRRAVASSRSPGMPLNGAFQSAGIGMVRDRLEILKKQGRLRGFVDPVVLARQLSLAVHMEVCDFTISPYEREAYLKAFASGPGPMLLGALCPEDAPVVAELLDAVAADGKIVPQAESVAQT